MRSSRRYPRLTQFDYLHLRTHLKGLTRALREAPEPVVDVLDVFCGTRPYDDLLPAGAHSTGLDIDNLYGAADVVTHEFLPFADDSFDLVMSIEAFHFVPDPVHGVAEIHRVLRPGGSAVITIPFSWEYDGATMEHRYTGPELVALFAGWDEVRVLENGGRGAAWATFTGRLVRFAERAVPRPVKPMARPLLGLAYATINVIGTVIEAFDRRVKGTHRWPMSLLVSARKPAA